MSKLNLLESFDSGSNYRFGDKMNRANNPRSLFDLGFSNTLTISNGGLLVPVGLFETIPGDDISINVTSLLRVMPQVVPLMSRQRLYIYGFWSRYSDLWNNWQVFIDRGYTGNVEKNIPYLKAGLNVENNTGITNPILADSLEDYLGIPIGVSQAYMFGSSAADKAKISALPWMMYLRIYRDYFMNKDEWINDRVMLPDDDSRFRIDDDGQLLSAKDISKKFYFVAPGTTPHISYDLEVQGNNYYMGLLFHDYPDDYFTSAKPFTQRGSTPSINKTIDTSQLGLDFSLAAGAEQSEGEGGVVHHDIFTQGSPTPQGQTLSYTGATDGSLIAGALNKGKVTGSNVGIQITLEDIRKVAIEQIELERMAMCDGSYAQFGLTFFGEVSKAAHDFRPTFFGGVYKEIAFTEVVQSAPSLPTGESTMSTPLGSYAGHGIAGMSGNHLGTIHCDDYGMIMLIACIMPDVYYHQGLKRIFTDSLESDKFKPDRAKLGMQPIYNKELYYAGNNGSDSGDDNYLWAYQNPFDYLRYNQNEIHGKIADSNNNSFYPFTQARKFNSLVNWGRNFSEAKDVRKDYLAGGSAEDAYIMQTKFDIRCVRELPYKAIPAQII